MSTTPPNNTDNTKPAEPQTVEEYREAFAAKTKALEAERAAHKETKSKMGALKGDEEAVERLVALRLEPHKAELDTTIGTLTKERDAAREEAKAHRAKWADDRRGLALLEAFARSGMIADFAPEALAAVRDVFEVTDDGKVQTKSGLSGIIPGASPDQYVLGQLRTMKPGLWPKSIGGGATGGQFAPSRSGDTSCFRDRNVTGIARYADKYGVVAAIREGQRAGVDVSWLNRGGGR